MRYEVLYKLCASTEGSSSAFVDVLSSKSQDLNTVGWNDKIYRSTRAEKCNFCRQVNLLPINLIIVLYLRHNTKYDPIIPQLDDVCQRLLTPHQNLFSSIKFAARFDFNDLPNIFCSKPFVPYPYKTFFQRSRQANMSMRKVE